MSYDVKLFIPVPGAGTPEEQLQRRMNEAERTVRALPLPPEDLQRIEAVMADARALDPAAAIQALHDGQHLKGFVVTDSAKLPYMEIGAEDGALAWSLSSDPRDLYRSLMAMTSLVGRHGYLAFDHQQGALVKPSDDFATFMRQFADQWPSTADFERWLEAETGGKVAANTAQPAKSSGQPNVIAGLILIGIIVWGAYKLHKAGYF
ncbi:MAG: hypothetical protein JNM76_03460 [Betaproteobacteria bacterium]|nr:hypothetical protein [Betaproteobacteria bacterium]